jgi:hypothetical protein
MLCKFDASPYHDAAHGVASVVNIGQRDFEPKAFVAAFF